MAEAAPQHLELPWGLLELCALLGPPRDSLRGPEQGAQKKGAKSPPSLAPEVLSVFVPPFVSKEDSAAAAAAGASSGTLGKAKRRSFRRKRDRPRAEPGRGPRGAEPEDTGIPDGVDLLALPQLCFPGQALFLQRQDSMGGVGAERGRGWLLRALRRVRGLQVPLLQRPQGLPLLFIDSSEAL